MPIYDRTFTIVKNNQRETLSIRIKAPPLEAQGLHFDTWGGAFVLSNLLHKTTLPMEAFRKNAFGVQVLELGSGTGLTGLSAAMIWSSSVLLTDFAELLQGIEKNIILNIDLLRANGGTSHCGSLDWRYPSQMTLHSFREGTPELKQTDVLPIDRSPSKAENKIGIILATDTVYGEEQPEILTNAITTWLRHDINSRVVICYPMRVAYIEYIREFWDKMTEKGLEPTEEGRRTLSDDDGFDDEKLYEWSIWKWTDRALGKVDG
ncbi:MAG: hypothetical protein GOMPHAMPRED_000396 [Gomphillus americanus]|uniref:Methyltransferase-domain-containing protein n=1 Tax=Gomphillus americanus TaxID=1940652 RepID=A0A8H3I3U5_9LECA|nr:MAG: hypothetical protein GOMPHAMPRED_000396 [Gomphillus americanus]